MSEWKEIKGWEGRYDISDDGKVRSWYYGVKKLSEPRLLKAKTDKYGYKVVCLRHKEIKKYPVVHRLVAVAFLPNPQNLPQINHIDGDKNNNSVNNLEWCSSQKNMRHAFDSGLISVQNMSEGQKRRYSNDSEIEKSKNRTAEMWRNPEYRNKVVQAHRTDEYRKAASERRKNQSSPTLGRRCVNNGEIEKRIPSNVLTEYLSNGWKTGRLPKERKGEKSGRRNMAERK